MYCSYRKHIVPVMMSQSGRWHEVTLHFFIMVLTLVPGKPFYSLNISIV